MTDAETDYYPHVQPHRARTRASRRGKSVLAVRAMAGETAWLDGRLLWHEGRVAWETPRGPLMPGAAEVARAQRRLNQIAGRPFSAQRALGDAAAWLERRRARLDLAKWLHTIAAPDLPDLARRAQERDRAALERLASLLVPEALCLNGLPISPGATLAACGDHAEPALLAALQDDAMPLAGRALAALALGAIRRHGGAGSTPPAALAQAAWPRRAYDWGRRSGLPDDPALLVAILASDDGPSLARRYGRASLKPTPLQLPSAMLRELLAEGHSVGQVVALAEAVMAAAPLAARLLRYRDQLPAKDSRQRRDAAARLQRERQQAVARLTEIVHAYARAGDPTLITTLTRFAHAMLDLGAVTPELADTLIVVLRKGIKLPQVQWHEYLTLLVDYHERLCPQDGFARASKEGSPQSWFDLCLLTGINPICALLRQTKDAGIAREALELNVQYELSFHTSFHTWRDLALYDLALDLMRQFGRDSCLGICALLDIFPDARKARAALRPLTQALSGMPPSLTRERLFSASALVSETVVDARHDLGELLTRLVPYLPRLAAFIEAHDTVWTDAWLPVGAVLLLDRDVPEQAHAWLDWLLPYLSGLNNAKGFGRRTSVPVEQATPLALTLAHGDLALFQGVVRAALEHDYDYDYEVLASSVAELHRYPLLHAPLARLFPRQPRRCLTLVVHAGLARRLGPGAVTPLLEAADQVPTRREALPPEWQALLATAPDLAPTVAAYLHAQEARGAPPELPPGVRRALDQPRRWAAELSHLDELIAQRPGRADLVTREANLRARLAGADAVRASVRDEAGDRLLQATAEAQLAAAEEAVQACYRAYLERIAEPLPPGLSIDEDLLNAILLSVDIRDNRRLLLRLLRAYVAGDRRWPERHPANMAFLKRLAAHGVDPVAWLSAYPRLYRCEGVAGGRLHLRLERDPLRVLQMGNLFDTCLSFGGINAHATVANACELNKRVVYARDGHGRIVGRKLIGLSDANALIGFRTYSALSDAAGNAALRAVIREYLTRFAAHCGLPLADSGTVPTLFVSQWYDDGAVAWNDEADTTAGWSKPARRDGLA